MQTTPPDDPGRPVDRTPAPLPRVVVGLGNPGPQYAATRHNVGFRVADELKRRHGGVARWRPLGPTEAFAVAPDVLVARPLSFMNRSGQAVRWLLEKIERPAEELLVVVDDVDLPLGRLRMRRSGGPGTHNGLRDLCDQLGEGFARLRIGVRGEGPVEDLAEYVLSDFVADEEEVVAAAVRRAADAVEAALRDGIDAAMQEYNRPSE